MNNETPRGILAKFYTDNNLGEDGGVNKPSVRIELGTMLHIYFPNFDARRKAVLKHDMHHLLTGYTTALTGECEISAWEIASGCKKYWAAFLLDTSGLMLGIPFYFWGTLKAFARGRRTKNLYADEFPNEQALDMKIDDLRSRLYLDKYPKDTKPTFTDLVLFIIFVLFGSLYSIILLIFLPFVILYTVYIELSTRYASR